MKILVTGAAGFIGFHLAMKLCSAGHDVIGIDNLNDYYDVSLKEARLAILGKNANFEFIKLDMTDCARLETLFANHKFDRVLNMAAQPGVRYSITNPHAYINANIVGFINLLECCRHQWCIAAGLPASPCAAWRAGHLIYASSSSVYGLNTKLPFSVDDNVDHPASLYAATKKANELMAHTYSHLYGIPTTGLRFFTVYGPWGRPDMAYFKFTKAILSGEPIDVYNNGNMRRDLTYIDDVVDGVVRVMDKIPSAGQNSSDMISAATSSAPYRVYNIGNNNPTSLMDLIGLIESGVGRVAKKNLLPIEPGDIPETYADIKALGDAVDFHPKTPIQKGINNFIDWYREYYRQ